MQLGRRVPTRCGNSTCSSDVAIRGADADAPAAICPTRGHASVVLRIARCKISYRARDATCVRAQCAGPAGGYTAVHCTARGVTDVSPLAARSLIHSYALPVHVGCKLVGYREVLECTPALYGWNSILQVLSGAAR